MVVLPAPLQRPVAPVPGGILIGAAADSPRLVTGPVVILGVPGMWSLSFCWGAGTALLVQVARRPVSGFVPVKPPEHCPTHFHSPSLIPVLE